MNRSRRTATGGAKGSRRATTSGTNRSRRATTSTWSSRVRGGQWWRRLLHRVSARGRAHAENLVGTDFAARRRRTQRWQRLATPFVVLGLVAALVITALRNDIVRMEYGLAESGRQEQELLDQQRRLTVERRSLLAPGRLYEIARKRGFVRPARVVEIDGDEQRANPVVAQRP